ncbi:MAG: hypothetical protein A2X56_14285, partial [Nitrospirae bacterium GWC2_57_13]
PQRLFLVWQGPEGGDRARCIVAELLRTNHGIELRYLTQSDDFKKARENGFEGYPAYPKTDRVYKEGVIETLMLRLPPRERSDYNKYLESLRISSAARVSDFALLGYSGAKLPSDGFSIVHPFDDVSEPCELLTEVAGFRYYEGMTMQLAVGMTAKLQPEPTNPYDPQAIMVLVKGKKVGYIGRGLLPALHRWLDNKSEITAVIEKINGRPERPSIMLFIAVVPQRQSEHALAS